MKPKTVVATILALAAALQLSGTAHAQISDSVAIEINPTDNPVVLGESIEIDITVTNNHTQPTPPLVIHIDITDPTSEHSVDPEDWTPTLSKTIASIDTGETQGLTWQLQPISAGTYSVYAVALSPGVDNTTISNIATVNVADQRSLNPGGILPVAIATPAILGALLAYNTRLRHRHRPAPAPTR